MKEEINYQAGMAAKKEVKWKSVSDTFLGIHTELCVYLVTNRKKGEKILFKLQNFIKINKAYEKGTNDFHSFHSPNHST